MLNILVYSQPLDFVNKLLATIPIGKEFSEFLLAIFTMSLSRRAAQMACRIC